MSMLILNENGLPMLRGQIGISKCFDVENQCVIDYDPNEDE